MSWPRLLWLRWTDRNEPKWLPAPGSPTRCLAAGALGAEIHLVTTSFAADTSPDEELLNRAAATLVGPDVRTEVIHHAFPAGGIQRTVEADGDSLLCLSVVLVHECVQRKVR